MLLYLLRGRGLVKVTSSDLLELLKAKGNSRKGYRIMRAVVSSTTVDIVNDSRALFAAGKAGIIAGFWFLWRRRIRCEP
jgi:hypothetical protein